MMNMMLLVHLIKRIKSMNEFIYKDKSIELLDGLSLELVDDVLVLSGEGGSICGNFEKMLPRLKQANLEKELLVKAARIKKHEGTLRIIDATAGLGEDSILLAAAGFEVYLFESDPVIGLLLENAIERALLDERLRSIVQRMHLYNEDSIDAMKARKVEADVIFLDPMFPERTKNASVKKKFQILQKLQRPCDNENELLDTAINYKPKKIIIKRPVKGAPLASHRVDYSYSGKAIRVDVIL